VQKEPHFCRDLLNTSLEMSLEGGSILWGFFEKGAIFLYASVGFFKKSPISVGISRRCGVCMDCCMAKTHRMPDLVGHFSL